MADVLLPPWLNIARLRQSYADNTGMTRGLYTGDPETTGFGGDRLRFSLEFTPTSSTQSAVERAALRAFLARLRGRQNRAYLWDPSYRLRGAFSTLAIEMLDSTFAAGTALSASNTNVTTAVTDRVMRATRVNAAGIADTTLRASVKTTVQYAPYVARVFGKSGRGPMDYRLRLGTVAGASDIATHATDVTTQGLQTVAAVVPTTTTHFSILDGAGVPGRLPYDYMDFPYVSFARAGGLVDNGTNLLLQSDEFDATWIGSAATVDDQATTAPDGTTTADAIVGTAVNTNHFVSQAVTVSSAAADYACAVAFKAGARSWGLIQLNEATGGGNVQCYFDLATGALGTISTGTNWANGRAFIAPLGNGWYYCALVAQKTGAATTITTRLYAASANTVAGFTGDGVTADMYAWRATLAQSGVPTRLVQTTTAASAGTNQTGSGLYIKGLPASTNGLLLTDDRFEVITDRGSEMKIVTAPLDSDAAGLGYLIFEPPLLGTPADNAPIIVHQPFGRFIFSGDMVGWSDEPGLISSASADFEEA